MKNLLSAVFVGALGLGSLSAQATLLTDDVSVMQYLTEGSSLTITHDLHPEIPTLYEAQYGWIVLSFADAYDEKTDTFVDTYDIARIEIPDHLEDAQIGGSYLYDYVTLGLTLSAIVDLNNADGLLNVTVNALEGSFWWRYSTLWVEAVDVPEPGTLLLLGTGLLVLGFASRRGRIQAA
jgi:hypothetical protein